MIQDPKKPGVPGSRKRREGDTTKPIPRVDDEVERALREAKRMKSKGKKVTLPLKQEVVRSSERETTTEIDIDEVEVVADTTEVKGEPTAKRPTAPPPPPRKAETADFYPEDMESDDIDADEWSTNPVKRLLKKLKK